MQNKRQKAKDKSSGISLKIRKPMPSAQCPKSKVQGLNSGKNIMRKPLFLSFILLFASFAFAGEDNPCVQCHLQKNVGRTAIQEWQNSKHFVNGVECVDCHNAEASDIDAWKHEGFTLAVIVTPKDCGNCHETEWKQFDKSHHSRAGEILGSLDNVLGEVAEGVPAAILGCKQCHGGQVQMLADGKPDPTTWPNTGIGRLNPDGSKGSCSACHSRHYFSAKVARNPENCGKCHLGPDHPQAEIYEESKHGIAFRANIDRMALDSDNWVLGQNYSAAPTCATCHMSATSDMAVTHDPGERISWTLRPIISKKQENWELKRANMRKVCSNCHSGSFVGYFYQQYDNAVELFNTKFAEPADAIMKKLSSAKLLTPTPFDEELEWTFYYLWHHEGRRGRMGASMMGPDYVQWHGFFEVAERFYIEFIPEAKELAEKNPEITAFIAEIMNRPEHSWLKGMSPEMRENIKKYYEDRYKLRY
jgi:hypothetical protein